MHEQMTEQWVNQVDAQVCMRVSAGICRHECFSTYAHVFSVEVNLVPASSVGYRLGKVVKERLIALWETKGKHNYVQLSS